MTQSRSPAYPGIHIGQAIVFVGKVYEQNRTNPVDREAAAKDMGYAGMTGSSSKTLADLVHFGLVEKAGKGAVRVTQRAVDILYPASEDGKRAALHDAAFAPALFGELRQQFPDGTPSENNLRSYLMRTGFATSAIPYVLNSYRETCRLAQESSASESHGTAVASDVESSSPDPAGQTRKFGGAKVGDLVQWEADGVLRMEKPMRVRLVTDDGWIAVEGSETGIPMDQVIVEERAQAETAAPTFKIAAQSRPTYDVMLTGETEWMRNLLGRDTKIRLMVSGEMGAKEIGKLIKLLEAQRSVLDDEDE